MITLDDLPSLERKVDKLKSKIQQAQGARNELLKRLKKEFGCKSLEEGKVLLKKMLVKENKVAIKYADMKIAFERKHRKALKGL